MRLLSGRWLFFIAWGALLLVLLNTGIGFWTLKRLERKARTPIQGIFLPHLMRPAFTLKNSNLAWRDRFTVLSGRLDVQYDPASSLFSRKLRVQVSGKEIILRLGEKWAGMEGLGEVKVDRFEADFAISDSGDPEIFSLNVNSPELEFHFSEKGSNSIKSHRPATEN